MVRVFPLPKGDWKFQENLDLKRDNHGRGSLKKLLP